MGDASVTVWAVKEWYVWPFAWMMAGGNYVRGVDDIVDIVMSHVRAGRHIRKFHVLSHGHALDGPVTDAPQGSAIDLGGGDRLSTDDFGIFGFLRDGTVSAELLEALKVAFRPGGELIFSACHQGKSLLLRDISAFLKGVTVCGYQGLGHPFGSGNMAYEDGYRIR